MGAGSRNSRRAAARLPNVWHPGRLACRSARMTCGEAGPMSESERFAAMMEKSAALKLRIARELGGAVVDVVAACERSIGIGGKLMFCGNGGSAADSQHLATEMLVRLRPNKNRRSIAALALTLDPALLTAGGNDYGYDSVFERPLRGLGRAGDVLFGITTSGRSKN